MIILTRTCSRHKLYPVFCKIRKRSCQDDHRPGRIVIYEEIYMKKKKSILHLCEATFLLLLLILISTLYLLKYLQAPGGSYSPMLHLIQLTLLLVVLTLALTLIQRELLSRLLVNAFRDITGIHNKTSLENKIAELGELPSTWSRCSTGWQIWFMIIIIRPHSRLAMQPAAIPLPLFLPM